MPRVPLLLIPILALAAAATSCTEEAAGGGGQGGSGGGGAGAGGSGGTSAGGSGGGQGGGGGGGGGADAGTDTRPPDGAPMSDGPPTGDAGLTCPAARPAEGAACRVDMAGNFCLYAGDVMCVCQGASPTWQCFARPDGGAPDRNPNCPATEPSGNLACTTQIAGTFCLYGSTRMCVCQGASPAWLCFDQLISDPDEDPP